MSTFIYRHPSKEGECVVSRKEIHEWAPLVELSGNYSIPEGTYAEIVVKVSLRALKDELNKDLESLDGFI